MGWILLAVVVAAWALAIFGVFNLWVALIVTVVAAVVGAIFLDLVTKGSGAAIKDQNRGNYSAPMGNQTWQVPTSYRPSDRNRATTRCRTLRRGCGRCAAGRPG